MMLAMTENTSQEQISQMFNSISSSYDKVNRVLSFGIDKQWRKKLAKHLPNGTNLRLLDLATGTCDQLLALMQEQKFNYGMGIDLSEGMLAEGQKKLDLSNFKNQVELKVASALEIPVENGKFDCVTISFGIRNVADTVGCLREMHRVLAPNGRALILEFSLPKSSIVKGLHLFYLRQLLPVIGGSLSGKKSAYSYLNKTIEAYPHGEAFLGLMHQAGFAKAEAIPLTLGIATLYVGERA